MAMAFATISSFRNCHTSASAIRPASTMSEPVFLSGLASSTAGALHYHLAGILLDPTAALNLCSVDFASKIQGGKSSLSTNQLVEIEIEMNGFKNKIECHVTNVAHHIILGGAWAEASKVDSVQWRPVIYAGRHLPTQSEGFSQSVELSSATKNALATVGQSLGSGTCCSTQLRLKMLLKSLRLRRSRTGVREVSGGGRKRKAADTGGSGDGPSKSQKTSTTNKKPAMSDTPGGNANDGGDGEDGGDGSDPGGNGSGGDPGPQPGKQPRMRVRKLEEWKVLDVPTTEKDNEITNLVSTLLQTNDDSLRNTCRIAAFMKGVKVRRIVRASVPAEYEAPLESYMQAQTRPGRAVSTNRWTKRSSKNNYCFLFVDDGSEQVFKAKQNPSLTVDFEILPKDTDRQIIDQVHSELARFFNTWPWTFTSNEKERPKVPSPLWISRILTKVQSRSPEIQNVGLHGPLYSIKIKYIDAKTGAMAVKSCRLSPSDATMSPVKVPALPPLILVEYGTGATPRSESYYIGPTDLDASETSVASQHKAQDALKWIAMQLQGIVASDARMDQLIGLRKAQLGIPNTDWYHGTYGNEGALYLFSRNSKERTTKVGPSSPLAADFKGITRAQLQLTVHSLNASRCTPVAETAVQLFTEGEDIRRMWLEAAITADQVNLAIAEGVPPTSECDCPDDTASSELHPCEGCGTPTLCFKRVVDSRGRLVCAFCDHKDGTHPTVARHPGETGVQYSLRTALLGAFRNECRVRGLDVNSQAMQAVLEEATVDIIEQLDPLKKTEYIDRYTGTLHDHGLDRGAVGKNPSRRRYVPWMLTPDAAFPEGQPEFKGLKHSPGNLETTSVVCNMAKYIHLPGVLHEVAIFSRIMDPSSLDKKRFMKKMENFTLARSKHRFLREFSSQTTQVRLDKAMAEMVRGEPAAGESGPWVAYSQRYIARTVPAYDAAKANNLWSDEVWSRLQECALSISRFFGVEPYILRDGTAWFGMRGTHPQDLDRNGIYQLFHERLARMRLVCNKKWTTFDNEETLYTEIILQSCASSTEKADLQWLKQKYGDRLGLLLTVFINSPLKFSVAHRTHGFGMLTGWPSPTPKDVKERIGNDADNNMLIESWYVNAAKLDIAEEYYDKVDQILRSCNVNTSRYTPVGTAPQGSGQAFEGSLDDIQNGDEFVGEDFDAAAFKDDGVDVIAGANETGDIDETGGGDSAQQGVEREDDSENDEGMRLVPGESMRESLQRIRGWILKDEELGQLFVLETAIVKLLAEAQTYADEGDERRAERARHALLEKLSLRTD